MFMAHLINAELSTDYEQLATHITEDVVKFK